MNIKTQLGAGHSKALTQSIVDYVGNDRERFGVLMALFLEGDNRTIQRAAWPLSYAAINAPQLVKPYFKKLIDRLNEAGGHPASKRNILRVFQDIDIPEKYQASVIDRCLQLISDPLQPIAVVAFAITTATKLCAPYAELKNELLLVLQKLSTYPQKPAVSGRIKRALKELK